MMSVNPLNNSINKLHANVFAESTPIRKRTSFRQNTPIIQDQQERDESERKKRRSVVEIQRRIASIHNVSASESPPMVEKDIKNHFDICIKMFAENKITDKNAWNLRFIDVMKNILYSNSSAKNSLQVAGTSLDVGMKVYGIRVDDIHSFGLKLAADMTRSVQETKNRNNADEDAVGENGENIAPKQKKRKHKRFSTSMKPCVADDPESLVEDIAQMEANDFKTKSDVQLSLTDNFFSSRTPSDYSGCSFVLLDGSSSKSWFSYERCQDPVPLKKKNFPFQGHTLESLSCDSFRNYEVNVWNPDNDESDVLNKTTDELIYDDNGIPLAELDGSIHDVFAEPEHLNYGSSTEDEEDGAAQIAIRGEISNICDMRPTDETAISNDYLYQSLNTNQFISNIWAGPSHWKLKHLQRASSRFSGATILEKVPQVKKKKKIHEIVPLDMNMDIPTIDASKKYKNKKLPVIDSNKYLMPQNLNLHIKLFALIVKPTIVLQHIFEKNKSTTSSEVNPCIGTYNYENLNDSQYCSQGGSPDDMVDHHDDNHHDDDHIEEIAMDGQHHNMAENLIDLPELVGKTTVGFATQAKKMDMKKLKGTIWKCLVQDYSDEPENEKIYSKPVHPITFKDIQEKLPNMLPRNMKEELSIQLSFISILHLANENHLKLTQIDKTNFNIEKL